MEAYALDRDDLDLYGAHVAVDFAVRLRATVRFVSVDDLVVQMHVDVDAARALTAGRLRSRARGTDTQRVHGPAAPSRPRGPSTWTGSVRAVIP